MVYLAGPGFSVLFLDLYLNHLAWVLNDLGNVSLVPSTDFPKYSFYQVNESAVHPELPEDPRALTKRSRVCLDHAEGSMDGPEDKEYDEKMMHVPEALKFGTAKPLNRRSDNEH